MGISPAAPSKFRRDISKSCVRGLNCYDKKYVCRATETYAFSG